MIPDFFDRSKIPHKPGIYIYKDKSGKILYVGKAIDLYHRVASYFNSSPKELRTMDLVSQIGSIETIIVESELEALILEANFIKKYLPPFNVRLTDDKDYLYIIFTKGDFPKVTTARKQDLKLAKKNFGPFPSSRVVKETLKRVRRTFPWCANPPPNNKSLRPCFYYHLGLCPGPCGGAIDQRQYSQIINNLGKLLDGKKEELIHTLTAKMDEHSKKQQFEEALKIKKTLEGIAYLTQTNRTKYYLENPNFLEQENQQALKELQKELNLPDLPSRIECFDISNIQGQDASGSMVVLTNGEIDKSQYRKFKITPLNGGKPNDYAMHEQVMRRRLSHPEWPLPQLFLIDGGRGQVRAALAQIEKKQIKVPVFGLAKRMEWLYPPNGEVVKLPKRSLALRLLQKIRDESHRFAISYHRHLRRKASGLVQ